MNDIRPKNPIQWIKYKLLERQWDRVLRGYSSWEHYCYVNDADYNPAGYTVRDQLHGYPYIALVPYNRIQTEFEPLFGPIRHGNHIKEWCDKNCRGKYRWHWERVIVDHAGQYLPNGIGGTDELFFAFKDERDYLMFVLKWC